MPVAAASIPESGPACATAATAAAEEPDASANAADDYPPAAASYVST